MTAAQAFAAPGYEPGSKNELLGRRQAAEYLDISISELRRREKLGFYQPTLIDEKGWCLYSPAYLESVRGHRSDRLGIGTRGIGVKSTIVLQRNEAPKNARQYEPEIAAQVFQELDKGTDASDIVIKLLVHPDTVGSIYEAWQRMRTMKGGGICVSAKTMEAISNLPLLGDWPAINEEQLLTNMREISQSTPMCHKCTKRPGRICMLCAEPEEIEMPILPATKTRTRKTG